MLLIDALDDAQKLLDLVIIQLVQQNQTAVFVQVDFVLAGAVDDSCESDLRWWIKQNGIGVEDFVQEIHGEWPERLDVVHFRATGFNVKQEALEGTVKVVNVQMEVELFHEEQLKVEDHARELVP